MLTWVLTRTTKQVSAIVTVDSTKAGDQCMSECRNWQNTLRVARDQMKADSFMKGTEWACSRDLLCPKGLHALWSQNFCCKIRCDRVHLLIS